MASREVTCTASKQTEGEARPLLDGCREVTYAASAQTEGEARPLIIIIAVDNNLGERTSTEKSRDIYYLLLNSNGEGNSLIYS
jgi:hypothetical protein